MTDYNFDPRLGWILGRDKRSLDFLMSEILPPEPPVSKVWSCPLVLDQGITPSCVGNGWTHWLSAEPKPVDGLNEGNAQAIYAKAQTLDQWPGVDYNGTSDLGGAKATKVLYPQHLRVYRWIKTLDNLIATLSFHGPVVVATSWYSSMYQTDRHGFVSISGNRVGGHCYLANEVNVEEKYIGCVNSWGTKYGQNGFFKIHFGGMKRLIAEQAELCAGVKA